MLEALRRYTRSGFVSYFFVALLILIFGFFFGVPTDWCGKSRGPQGPVLLASVGGEDIDTYKLNLVYNNQYFRAMAKRRSQSEQPTRNRQTQADPQLRGKALRNMLLIKYFAQKARNQGLRVSKEELRSYITDGVRNPEFKAVYGRNGKWNGQRYKRYVKYQLMSEPDVYEDYKKEELLARKYLSVADMQIGTIPTEVDEAYKAQNTEINLEFIKFDPKALADTVGASESQIQGFLEDRKKEVKTHYEDHKSEYEKPEKVRIRRVFISKPGEKASKEKIQTKKDKFKKAKKRVLDKDQKLAKVAGQMSEDYARKKDGLMNWSEPGNLDQNIADAIEGADVGSVHTVETDYAYMLVKVEDRQESQKTPFEEAKKQIAAKLLKRDKVKKLIPELATKLQKQAENSSSLEEALAQIRGSNLEDKSQGKTENKGGDASEHADIWSALKVETTGTFAVASQGRSFSKWYNIPKIGDSKDLAAEAYANLTAQKPMPTEPYEIEGSTVVVRLKSKETPKTEDSGDGKNSDKKDDQNVEQTKQKIEQQLTVQKKKELLGNWEVSLFGYPPQQMMRPWISGQLTGPWIKSQFKKAIKSGDIKLHKDKHESVKFAQFGAASPPGGGMAGAKKRLLKKLKSKKGGKGKKSPSIKLKPSKGDKKGGDKGGE